MIEDDMYRTSSQYRYWTYTKQSLAELRQTTNRLASGRVLAAFQRVRYRNVENGAPEGASESHIETLTVDEELKIVHWGCSKIVEMGQAMEPRIPINVVATAIQYLRRFYLTNSPMTYHPKQIMTCALFLATKSDHWHISLHKFVSQLANVTEDDVKAPEFLLMQGLRFTLDVRHPMRGLDGGVGEMQAMARAGQLEGFTGQTGQSQIGTAADSAKSLLRTAAQITDAYFLYSPPQIWLGAMLATNRDLIMTYLTTKLRSLGDPGEQMLTKLLEVVSACAELLLSYTSPEDDVAERREMRRIGKKLEVCQNPEKLDIVAVAKAKAAEKREGNESDAEKALKKRKLEREKLERDGDVFGPDLKTISQAPP